jgi:hypothetical protein
MKNILGKIEIQGIWNCTLTDKEIQALASGADPLTIRPDNILYPSTNGPNLKVNPQWRSVYEDDDLIPILPKE